MRYSDIKEQIQKRTHCIRDISYGMERLIIGLSKKVLIANTLARYVDLLCGMKPTAYLTIYAWFMAIAYSLQIYYDFSGYSDMAIGLGRIFGFYFKENFISPYAAKGIRDFWHRWHISLSSWFKDYVYIPLGGNRISPIWTTVNKYIVFALTGLWHGASVNFILWGLGHGTLMMIEDTLRRNWTKVDKKLPSRIKAPIALSVKVLWRLIVLLAIMLLWVLFRNVHCEDGIKVILNMFGVYNKHSFMNKYIYIEYLRDLRFWLMLGLGSFLCIPWAQAIRKLTLAQRLYSIAIVKGFLLCAKPLILLFLFIASCASLSYGGYNPFIYFRF